MRKSIGYIPGLLTSCLNRRKALGRYAYINTDRVWYANESSYYDYETRSTYTNWGGNN